MKKTTWIKNSIAVACLGLASSAGAVPGTGGIYDWWSGTAHFGSQGRMAQGGSLNSCQQDLYTQKQIGISQGMTFTGYTYCTKSKYKKFYLLAMVEPTPAGDDPLPLISELEGDFQIDQYRKEVKAAHEAYESRLAKQTAEYSREKEGDRLSDAELESIEMLTYLPFMAELKALGETYRIEEFKKKVEAIFQDVDIQR